MRRRWPGFSFHSWLMPVVLLPLPLACSGSSRKMVVPKPAATVVKTPTLVPSASASASVAFPSGDSCDVAANLRKKVKPFFDDGRLHRTVRLIEKADRLCPTSASDTYVTLVTALVELGEYKKARAVAKQIEADTNASTEARSAASAAKEKCDRLDKAFPAEGAAKEAMKRLYLEALAAEQKPDPESQKLAKEKYLAAWEAWRPNGQALLSAGFAAKKLGQQTEAQRLFDRAIVDGEKAQGSEVMLDVPNGFTVLHTIAWAKDGRRFAVAHGNELSIFDSTWREKFRLRGQVEDTLSVALAPDSKTLATSSRDGVVQIWDVATGNKVGTLEKHADNWHAIAYSLDGATLATSSQNTVKLWDIATGKLQQTLTGHEGAIVAMQYAPDGKVLASASEDKTIRLWNVVTGSLLKTLRGHTAE